jgi:molybdopterin converting factor small subunit
MKINISMFGPLKAYFNNEFILDSASTKISQVRDELLISVSERKDAVLAKEIISKSVFANNEKILAEDDELGECNSLTLLPPVCGG